MNQVSLLIGSWSRDLAEGPATLNSPKLNEIGVITTMERLADEGGLWEI